MNKSKATTFGQNLEEEKSQFPAGLSRITTRSIFVILSFTVMAL